MDINSKINKAIQKAADKINSSGVSQEENSAEGKAEVFPGISEYVRRAGAEGAVLLKNNGILPIKDEIVSVFGRCQLDWFYVGYGSGGDVNAPYTVNLIDGLKNDGVKLNERLLNEYRKWCGDNPVNHGFWGHWPMCYPEMKLDAEGVLQASRESDIAFVIIGRAAGEDRENKLMKGSYYLTDSEIDMLNKVCGCFERVAVIMNCGNIIDMSEISKYGDKIGAVIYAWQCGMESGNSLADILTGRECPSGKLTDTIAVNYDDYPSASSFGGRAYNNYTEDIFVGYRYFETFDKQKVLYPFGFGLSYTKFAITVDSFEYKSSAEITVTVKNIGECTGREVVQAYVTAPDGKLKKAEKSLVCFAKTKALAPSESEKITFKIEPYSFSSYDESSHSYIIEKGEYVFSVGNSVRDCVAAGKVTLESEIIEELSAVCPVKNRFSVITGEVIEEGENTLRKRILENLPKEIGFGGDKGLKLCDVKSSKVTLDEFVSQLSNDELEALTRGQGYMDSELGTAGNAGAFGGILKSLRDKGIPPVITTDGPAGIRLEQYTSLVPCGTALACTWNTELVEELFSVVGKELVHCGSDVLLAPGMNIHRNVLCGRNFEYFSEDPLVSGKTAAAVVRGVQSAGVSACPKHFACNNQEVNRTNNDSRVSERALREIYLKGFEICVKEASPLNIMTSYNKVNGVWSHYNYDLVTTVLRKEWGYEGNVITDWWMRRSSSPEFPEIKNNAYRVRAQVDVLMPGGLSRLDKSYKTDGSIKQALKKTDGITRGELERSAKNVLRLILKIKKL